MTTATQLNFFERMEAIRLGKILPEEEKLTPGAVATYLGVSLKHVCELGEAGALRRYRISHDDAQRPSYRYYRASVVDFETRRQEGCVS